MTAPVGLAPIEPVPTAAAAALIGPDMTQLWRCFPPRTSAPSWAATEQAREALLDRLLAAPFTVDEDRVGRARRRLGLVRLLGWLGEQPGETWQQRWLVSGADAMGNAGWWRALLAWARPRNPRAGLSASSNLRVCALLLAGADVIRPSLDWVLTPRAPQNRADWGRRVAAAADGDYLELPGAHLSQGHSSAWWEPVGVRRPVAVTMSARPDAVPRRPGRPCDSSSGRLAG